jgi:hypothetical protein
MRREMQRYRIHYRWLWITLSWLVSLMVSALLLVLGDFGAPAWVFVLCLSWLLTCGLPTTLTLLAMAAFWRALPGIGVPPLTAFALSGGVLSLVAQTIGFEAVVRVLKHGRKS